MEKRIEEIKRIGPTTRDGKIAVLTEDIRLCEERINFYKQMYDDVDKHQYWLDGEKRWMNQMEEFKKILIKIK